MQGSAPAQNVSRSSYQEREPPPYPGNSFQGWFEPGEFCNFPTTKYGFFLIVGGLCFPQVYAKVTLEVRQALTFPCLQQRV